MGYNGAGLSMFAGHPIGGSAPRKGEEMAKANPIIQNSQKIIFSKCGILAITKQKYIYEVTKVKINKNSSVLRILVFGLLILCISICARAEEIPKQATLYYDNSVTQWGTVYIYIWGPKEHFRPWGDKSMPMSADGNICTYTLALDDKDAYTHIIFWDGASQQTQDLAYSGGQRIFKSVLSKQDHSTTRWSGNWYTKDDGRLAGQKLGLKAANPDWYTPGSYETLRLAVLAIPDVYSDAYLLVNEGASQYETDYQRVLTAYQNLQYSPAKLTAKVTELEAKSMTGYTHESVVVFRNSVDQVKTFIEENVFDLETLESNYNKLIQSSKLLVISNEEGGSAAVDQLKSEIDKLSSLLKQNSADVDEIIRICGKIEASYKELTQQNSGLTGIVNQLLNNADKNNTAEIGQQLDGELKKMSALLATDKIKVDDLIAGYEEMESNYQSLAEKNYDGTGLLPQNMETDTAGNGKLVYLDLAIEVIQTLLIALIAVWLVKKS